jgi:hypothetical protein
MSEPPVSALSPWASSLQGTLTPAAARTLERAGAHRDPARTCSPEELAALLQKSGLPVYNTVLELERLFGGVTWGKDTFGACAALRSGKDLRTLAGLVGGDLADYLGETFIPISFREHLPRAYHWMNAAGVIYLVHEADSFPAADSAACFWEREALKAWDPAGLEIRLRWLAMPSFTDEDFEHFEPPPGHEDESDEDEDEDDAPPALYADDPQAPLDARLAEVASLPVFEAASDRWRRVWFDGDRLLYPPHPWQPADRLVRAASMDGLVQMACAALAARPGVVALYRGPLGDPPAADEPIVARLPAVDEGNQILGDLLFAGAPGRCRAHLARREQPIALRDLWERRREAWEARRSGA